MRVGASLLILCALEGHARNNSVSIDLMTQMTWTNSLKETNDQNSLKKKNMILCLANTIILVVETFKNKSIIVFSEKKISNYSFHSELKKIYLLIVECLIKNNWKLYQIDEFLSKKIKFNSKFN